MLQLNYEGFKIETDINEAAPYCRMYPESDGGMQESDIIGELMGIIDPSIEAIIEGKKPDLSRGYKPQYRHCEPYKVSESKAKITVSYTGAQGGDPYEVIIYK